MGCVKGNVMDFFDVLTMLGGLAMFLYGMEIMGNGLRTSAGPALKKGLAKLTKNVVLGMITGLFVTAIIQSSTATIVLTVGLIGAGILDLRQAASIVMGANIGTTVTGQILRLMDIDASGSWVLQIFEPATLAPVALLIGIVFIMFLKKPNLKGAGEICIGFGVLFSGLMTMTASVTPLSGSAAFTNAIGRFSEMPIMSMFTGLVLTMIVQSSSAMIGMVQALSSTGVLTFKLIYPLIMGIDIGTCVTTALVCSIGTSKDAKRVGIVHILFNTTGTIVFMIAISILRASGAFPELWESIVNSGDIANFSTLFKVVTAVMLFPFTALLVKTAQRIIPSKEEPMQEYPELDALNDQLLTAPAVALYEASHSIAVMGDAALANFISASKQFEDYDDDRNKIIQAREDRLDAFADTADNFLVKLSRHISTQNDNTQLNLLMQSVPNFERIGDYATDIDELALRLRNENRVFSEQAQQELKLLTNAVVEIIAMTVQAFEENDEVLATRIEPLEEVIDDMVGMLRDRHTERLKEGVCTVTNGLVFIETLTYLERASDQCSSTAMLMLARHNEDILRNHHEYLRELHKGEDNAYAKELASRQKEYIDPLLQIS